MIWGKISSGWISMSYVTLDQASQPETESGGSTQSGKTGTVTCAVLNVRKGAGVNYGIAGYYYKGNTVTITEQKTVGATTWGKTAKGWVSMDYIKLDSSTSDTTEPPADSQPAAVSKTVTVSCLCVRSGAGTSNTIVGYLYKGSKVSITETKTVGSSQWGKTAQGWICLDYTK